METTLHCSWISYNGSHVGEIACGGFGALADFVGLGPGNSGGLGAPRDFKGLGASKDFEGLELLETSKALELRRFQMP